MKNTIFALLFIMIPGIGLNAQNKIIREFEDRYEDRHGVTTITIDGSIVKFAGWLASFSDEDEDEIESLRRLSKGLKKIHIITIDHWNDHMDRDELDELEEELVDEENYEIVLTAREKGETSKILSKFGEGDELKDVVIIAKSHGELTIICLDGKFKLEDVEPLIKD